MAANDSVTRWIAKLKKADSAAYQALWERYFLRLVHLARKRLQATPRRVADEEDVALAALRSFFRGVEQGRFPQLLDRNDLWQILVVLTARKAVNLQKFVKRQKRGGGHVLGESALSGKAEEPDVPAFAQVISREPTPQFAAQAVEECERLLNQLDDAELRTIALLKLEGFTNDEIATRLDCAAVTIERRLRLIRTIWTKENPV